MKPLVAKIILALRAALGDECDIAIRELDDESLCRLLFLNHRHNSIYTHGLRLTHTGLDLLKRCFASYPLALAEKGYNVQDLVYLDRFSNLPYFIEGKQIVLFDQHIAVMLRMNDGDLTALRDTETF